MQPRLFDQTHVSVFKLPSVFINIHSDHCLKPGFYEIIPVRKNHLCTEKRQPLVASECVNVYAKNEGLT